MRHIKKASNNSELGGMRDNSARARRVLSTHTGMAC